MLGLGLGTMAGHATNGDIFIGIGPISRAMGGTGVAAPQDAISAVFSNPAAMCLSELCSQPQADFALTAFLPQPSTSITVNGNAFNAKSKDATYVIPAMGVSFPIGGQDSHWRLGFAAYGVSGLGVNYRGTAVDQNQFYPGPDDNPPAGPDYYMPLAAGIRTDLAIAKFAPSVAYAVSPDLSLGLSIHMDRATLDLGAGRKTGLGGGVQLGAVWKPRHDLRLGLTYVSPQLTKFGNVTDFDGNGTPDSLKLEMPQQVAVGVAWTGLNERLLVEVDGRYLNWAGATGYDDFDWEDQWVVGLGVQYAVVPHKVFLRAGYNYGNNPVKEHNGWNGMAPVTVQGKTMPRYYYESFRTVGFPAVETHHFTLGVGWAINEHMMLNIGWMHAFETGMSGSGNFGGASVRFASDLYEDSIDIGLTWRY